jgi:hypothetical protein
MTGARIAVPLALAVALGIGALAVAPRGFDAAALFAAEDDPVALADRVVSRRLDAATATREIEAALAARDVELARSFLELARERGVPVAPALAEKVEQADTAQHSVESFARGLVTGEPDDLAGLAGTAVGDLFVFGDIRDAVREGGRLAAGQEADHLILGLSGLGIAITAGTYVSVGAAAPARVGLTVVKAARRTGRIGSRMAAWLTRSLGEAADWPALARAFAGARLANPVAAVRAAREAVKVEKAQGLVRFVGDVGRVQASAGTRAALDGLKLAEGPRDMTRLARLAAAKGGKTRAILKLGGRGAIMLTVGAFQLASWILWSVLTLLGFVTSLKRTAERMTERSCRRRRKRRARLALRAQAAPAARAKLAPVRRPLRPAMRAIRALREPLRRRVALP